MGAALLLALALAGGGRFERVNSRTEHGRSDRGLMSSASYAMFEFAPASGAGMGAACACAAVTGARGEALTFSRASVGSCIKGSTTSLANGDMVICASGQPRVMPGGDGTGSLGLLVEGSGTNVVTRSEALDNAAYADYTSGGAAAPTVTADAATAPTGTATADMLTLPTTGLAEDSGRSIAVLTAAAYSAQVYLRGVTGPGDFDLCIEQTVGATCSTCAYTASSWSLCTVQNVTSIAGGRVLVGHLNTLSGVDLHAAASVYVWGLDAKLGAVATSYVPTAGSATARAIDVATIDLGASAPPANNFSAAATKVGMSDSDAPLYSGWFGMSTISTTDVSNRGVYAYKIAAGAVTCSSANDAATPFASGFAVTTDNPTPQRWACWSSGAIQGNYKGAAMTASAAQTGSFSPARYVTIGSIASAFATNGVISRVCVDPDPTRCR